MRLLSVKIAARKTRKREKHAAIIAEIASTRFISIKKNREIEKVTAKG